MLNREQAADFVKLYRKMRADLAKANMTAEEADKLLEQAFQDVDLSKFTAQQIQQLGQANLSKRQLRKLKKAKKEAQRKFFDAISVRYLENPEARDEIVQNFPELAEELDKVRDYIDNLSREAMSRGILLPSQFKKWEGKYLSRLYLIQNPTLNAKLEQGIKMQKINKGRKIESIIDWIVENPQRAKALGVVIDPNMMVKMTIAKTQGNIAIEEFFRGASKGGKLVNPNGLVHLDSPIANLPTDFSPSYAKSQIIPYIKDMIGNIQRTINNAQVPFPATIVKGLEDKIEELKEQIKDIKEQSDIAEGHNNSYDEKKYAIIPNDPLYGSIAGLPMEKDIVSLIKSQVRMAKNPEMFADHVDKAGSALLAWFKTAKVPLNFFSYPRNFVSNQFQWAMSGADPVQFIPRYLSAIVSYSKKDEWYARAREQGVIDDNMYTEEFKEALDRLSASTDKKYISKSIDKINKLASYYGLIDDIAKIARMKYAIQEDGKTDFEGAEIAQNTHYDYGLTYDMIRQVRDPSITKAPMLKLLTTLFPTYTQKTIAFVYDTIINRPMTLLAISSALLLMIKSGNDDDREEVGEKKYEEVMATLPEWVKNNPLIRIDMKLLKSGEVEVTFTDISYVVPFGSLTSSAYALSKGNIGEALSGLGAGGSPLQMIGNLKVNRDSFTGREIYTELDGTEKAKDIALYLGKQFSPGTFTKLYSLSETKHPIMPRLAGVNTYIYNKKELARRADYASKRALLDAGKRQSFYKRKIERAESKYEKGEISLEEFNKIEKKNSDEIEKWRSIGENKSNELNPKSKEEQEYKSFKWKIKKDRKHMMELLRDRKRDRVKNRLSIERKYKTLMKYEKQIRELKAKIRKHPKSEDRINPRIQKIYSRAVDRLNSIPE
ncbi:MAG: hypothetical protein DRH03_11110 [Deltaproteobacteria bacterium]|nr:MAG: hypothetical protein DRH03_11110 [Deltaproteobacteria bacterium]